MRFIIFGGGCYGSFYARQLLKAQAAGVDDVAEIIIVDRNEYPRARRENDSPMLQFVRQTWDSFCDEYFGSVSSSTTDQIVPPPFTPHLALAWLLRRLAADLPDIRWSLEPAARFPGTPFQQQSTGGPVTLSHAAWMCPVHCIEPATCPKTRALRYWDMAHTIEHWVHALDEGGQPIAQTHLFQCLHYSHGVGTYPAANVVQARAAIASVRPAPGRPARFLVGTISRCHGAVNILKAEVGTDTVSTGGQFFSNSSH